MTALQRVLINVACLALLSAMAALVVYACASVENRDFYSLCTVAVIFALFPVFNRAVNLAGPARSTIREWTKSVALGAAIIGGMLAIDILLGYLSHPEWPVIKSTTRHLGFVVTLFVSPVLLAAIFGLLRAVLLSLFFPHRIEP